MCRSAAIAATRSCRFAMGRRRSACSPPSSSDDGHRFARRPRRRRRDRDRARAVPGRTRRRGAGAAEGRSRRDAARLAQPRSAHAVDGDQAAVENLRGELPRRRTPGTGARRQRRTAPAHAAVPGHPRHGAHRRGRDPRGQAVGHGGRCRGRGQRARPSRARRTRAARGSRRRSWKRRSIPGSRPSPCRTCSRTPRNTRPPIARSSCRRRSRTTGCTCRSPIAGPASIPASSSTCSSASIADTPRARRRSEPAWDCRSPAGLLAAAGGRIWAENVGGGARFSMVIPGAVRRATVSL